MDIMSYVDRAFSFLESISGTVDKLASIGSDIASVGADIASVGSNLADATKNIRDFVAVVFFGGGSIVAIVILVAILLGLIMIHIISSIPIYRLANKMKRKTAWWAWVPIAQSFALCDVPGEEPLELFGKRVKLKNRMITYLILSLCSFFSPYITIALGICCLFIPVLGITPTVLAICVAVVFVIDVFFFRCKHLVLRDAMNAFSKKRGLNSTLAFVATALDSFLLHISLCRSLVLYTYMGRKPLVEPVDDDDDDDEELLQIEEGEDLPQLEGVEEVPQLEDVPDMPQLNGEVVDVEDIIEIIE